MNSPNGIRAVAGVLALLTGLPTGALSQIAPPPKETEAPAQPGPIVKPPELVYFVDATYPADAFEQRIEASVVMLIDIAADGTVARVEVTQPAGQGFDEAAEDAVWRFRFSPAEDAAGSPVPVRVEYTYDFFIAEAPPEPTPDPVVPAEEEERVLKIRGSLSELGARAPVVGEAVLLVETGAIAVSDDAGQFEFYDVAPGDVTLQVPEGVFYEASRTVTVPEEGFAEPVLQLEVDPLTEFSTLVRGRRESAEPTKTEVSIEEAKKQPGTGGDPLRVVQNLPGVARSPGFAGALIVRGSNPNDSSFRLNGQQLPQLYHFFGIYSVIPAEFLDEIVFYPGGFSTKYGDTTGGLVEVNLNQPELERWTGQADINLFHTALFAQGPLWDGGTLQLGLRRSYIDAVLPAFIPDDQPVTISTAPVYYDYQVRLDQRFDDQNHLRLLIFGSDDQLAFVLKEPSEDDPDFQGRLNNHTYFHLATLWYEHKFDPTLELTSSISAGQQQLRFGAGSSLQLDLDLTPVTWREDLTWRPTPAFTLLAGTDSAFLPGAINVTAPLPPGEGSTDVPLSAREIFTASGRAFFARIGVYSDAIVRPHERFTLTTGVRYDGYFGDWRADVVSPRASFRWNVGATTTLKGGVGIYYRRPDFAQLDETFGDPNLRPERALQTSLGIEQVLYEGLTIDVQGFYKKLDDLVRPTNADDSQAQYDNGGKGRAYGAEVLLRQNLGIWFWGWVSYTFLVAERKDNEEDGYRPFDFDQTHVLTAVASFRLPWQMEISTRFRYVTGNPFTPANGAYFDADAAVYVQNPGAINSDRFPDFHQLDIRVDKTWLFDSWSLVAYLELWNVYNRQNAEFWDYNYNYTQRSATGGLPILPAFGITAKF